MINHALLEKMFDRLTTIDLLRRGELGISVETLSPSELKVVEGLHRLKLIRLVYDDSGHLVRPLVYRTSVDGLTARRRLERHDEQPSALRAPDRAPIAGSGTKRFAS
jgi:hypothetical protein